MTPNAFLWPDLARKLTHDPKWYLPQWNDCMTTSSSCPQAWLMSQWIFICSSPISVPRNSCSGIGLHWSQCKFGGCFKCLIAPNGFFYNKGNFQGQLKVTQESQVTGPCTNHAWACNNPKTWEHDTAQPIMLAQYQYSLCDCNHNKNTACNRLRLFWSSPWCELWSQE